MINHIEFWILIYFVIGLSIYFTFPNRKAVPVHITMPFIVAWLFIGVVFLFNQPKQPKK